MNNDKNNRQPMFMRASVSGAFDEKLSPKRNFITTFVFIIFLVLLASVISWVIFLNGSAVVSNVFNSMLGQRAK